jgi:hypothetical protein
MSYLPAKYFWWVWSPKASYCFYEDALIIAAATLEGSNYEEYATKLDAMHQYVESGSGKIPADWLGNPHDLSWRLYKRSGTNTRIYLIKDIGGLPYARVTNVYAWYIPNSAVLEIKRLIDLTEASETTMERNESERKASEAMKKLE